MTAPATMADLSIAKSDDVDPIVAGNTLTYTVAVTNAGPDAATTVSVTDTLPAGVTFASATGTGWMCGEAAGVVTCTRPTLAVGPAPDITIGVTVDVGTTGLITNTVDVAATTADPTPGNDSTTEGTTVMVGVPTIGELGLALLLVLLTGIGVTMLRRRTPTSQTCS